MTTEASPRTIALSALPALNEPLDDGIFAGVLTQPDGAHVAVVLLPDQGNDLTWKEAGAWAKQLDAQLPTRPVAALLYANAKDKLRPMWHWTSETFDASYAWGCDFSHGYQGTSHKSFKGSAVAVRRVWILQSFHPFDLSH